jgi:hypothetical protein
VTDTDGLDLFYGIAGCRAMPCPIFFDSKRPHFGSIQYATHQHTFYYTIFGTDEQWRRVKGFASTVVLLMPNTTPLKVDSSF